MSGPVLCHSCRERIKKSLQEEKEGIGKKKGEKIKRNRFSVF
jgi:hypothetical protein